MKTKLFQQDGFPTQEGEQWLKPFQECVSQMLTSEEVSEMGETQLRVLSAWMTKMVKDAISKKMMFSDSPILDRKALRISAIYKYNDLIISGTHKSQKD